MSISRSIESPNTPVQELYNFIKYKHPNLKSQKIHVISNDKDLMYFQILREVEIPVSTLLINRLFKMSSNVVTLITFVKFYKDLNTVELVTNIPKKFEQYVSGSEKIFISHNAGKTKIDVRLEYLLFPVCGFVSIVETTLLKRYQERRLSHFANNNLENKVLKAEDFDKYLEFAGCL